MAKTYVPVTWRLAPELYEALKAAARAQGKSVQAFALAALQRAIAEAAAQPEDDIWAGIIGGGCGGPADVAARHDYYLAKAYREDEDQVPAPDQA